MSLAAERLLCWLTTSPDVEPGSSHGCFSGTSVNEAPAQADVSSRCCPKAIEEIYRGTTLFVRRAFPRALAMEVCVGVHHTHSGWKGVDVKVCLTLIPDQHVTK